MLEVYSLIGLMQCTSTSLSGFMFLIIFRNFGSFGQITSYRSFASVASPRIDHTEYQIVDHSILRNKIKIENEANSIKLFLFTLIAGRLMAEWKKTFKFEGVS